MSLIFIDCEAPFGVGAPSVGNMTEFGAVEFNTRATFHGQDCSKQTFVLFEAWINEVSDGQPTMISDRAQPSWL